MIADIYELSPIQAGMLFHRIFAPESTAYFDQFSCRLTGPVDTERLRRAWQAMVDRHPIFRTSFHWEGMDNPVQVVHHQADLPWTAHDWRAVPAEGQRTRWDACLEEDRARGFDPGVPPLMRVTVAQLGAQEYAFCWSHHHLLLDGWCLTLVLAELFERYACLADGRVPSLAPVRPFSEYIKWLQQRDRGALDTFWRDTLRGFDAPTTLPAAAAGRPAPDAPMGAAQRELTEDLTGALRAVAARHRLTLNTLIHGAWALLLSRYSGNPDVVFGATVSGRPPELPGVETMLGVFINTVPVRVLADEQAQAAAWLTELQTRHVARESFAAIALPDIQKLSDVEAGTPLFDTNVIVMNYRMDDRLAGGGAGLHIHDVRVFDQTDVPLTLQVTPGARLALEIVYDAVRFDAAMVSRMLGHVEQLLTQFAGGLDRPLSSFEILTPAERTQLFEVFNATDAPLDRAKTALDLFERRAAETPDAIALECDGIRLSYRALDGWANRLARALLRQAPLGRDTLAAVAFPRSERLVAAILAIWKCGAAYVPIDPDYPAERIRQVLDAASPLIVLTPETMDALDAAARSEDDGPLDRRPAGSDLAYVIFTSGSTGQPKGAMIEHTGMLNHILAKLEDFQLGADSVIVQNASHCFDISVWQCFAALLAGGRTLVYRDELVLDPAAFLARVRVDRVTLLEVVPSYLAALLDRFEDDARPFADLRVLMVTGETVKPSLVERWFRLCPAIPLANAYGPTEASDDITHAILRAPSLTPSVPIGRPVRNFHIYIVDEQMRLCPVGVSGELCVSGPGVGRGYLHDPARTAAAFLDDPFRPERGTRMYRTGDIGYYTDDGTLLLSGRKDQQVKVRGYRIELGDIEAALTKLAAVRDAAVVSRRDRAGDAPYLAAYVSLREGADASGLEILEQLAARLPEYMVPAVCTVLAHLPVTPNGKIDRKALPAPAFVARAAGIAYAAPRTPIEETLARIWSDALGVERPGIHDNFFALGGDSILSMQIVSRAAREGLAITPRDIFQQQTIAELAAQARQGIVRRHAVSRDGLAPLTPAQRQFFADVTIDRHHYNQSILLDVPAGFDPERCARALAALVSHHDALRLRFVEGAGGWQQSVARIEDADIFQVHDAAEMPAIAERLQTSLDLLHGPVVRAAFFTAGASQPGRLMIAAHHLAIDGVSWRVLVDDLATAYDDLGNGNAVALPPVPTSYLEWADRVADANVMALPPASTEAARDTVGSSGEISVELSEALTRRFLSTASRDAAGGSGALLAAVGIAFAEWSKKPQILVDIESHGRDHTFDGVDVTRTIGWFTSTSPVSIDGATGRTAGAAPSSTSRPEILFNYHGRIEQPARSGWRLSTAEHGAPRSLRQHREYAFEVNGLVADGRLRLTIGYGRNAHSADVVRGIARRIEDQLTAIVNAPAHSLPANLRDAEDVYDLSPTQHGMLFHALLEPDGQAYFNQLTCVLRGPLDVTAFREAWRMATARHPALRTSFHWKDVDRPLQAVHAAATIPWQIEDWSALRADEQDRRWIAESDADRRRPFDLSVAPLMRCAISKTSPDTHRFRWSQHHLLLDGWSSSIVLNDVLAAYDALRRGERDDRPAPPLFRDNVAWLQRQDQGEAERFWRAQLAGFASPTPLVLGLPELEGRAGNGTIAEAETLITPAVSSRLKALAAANQITMNTLFQGVWAILLSRYAGQDDVVFGAITSGRSPALSGSDQMVGLFINTVPVRAIADPRTPAATLLRDLQRANADREVFSFSPLADVQRWSPIPGGTPLFDTIVIFENYPIAESLAARESSLTIDRVEAYEPNNYPMTFVVTPGESIGLKIMFDEDRFDRATIDRVLGHITTLLAGIEAAPDRPIGELPLLTPQERDDIASWNRTTAPLPDHETVLSLFEAHARAAPDRVAAICDGERVTYGDLNERATALARAIRAATPVEAGSRVAVLLRRSLRLPEAALALWKCGAAYVPIDPDYPDERIAAILASAKPAIVIADSRELTAIRADRLRGQAPILLLDQLPAAAPGRDADPESPRDPAALAYVIFTSGSTGAPKGAMLEHRGFLNHVLSMAEELSLNSDSVVAQTASHGFDISMWQLFAALASGGAIAIYRDAMIQRPAELAARFESDGVTAAQFVPSYLNVFLDALEQAGSARPALASLTHMILIGEALKHATITRWFALYPRIPLMNAYGPTEASDSVAHHDMTQPPAGTTVPLGRPIRNTALYIVDRSKELCAAGVKGEICIGGAGVGRGYLFDEARTREVFVADPFAESPGARMYRTGDVGAFDANGRLYFFGRRDFQVKVRGHRVELGEIEACLAAIDGVRDAAVVAREDDGETSIRAFAAPQAGRSLTPESLSAILAEKLPRHFVPAIIRVMPELPVMSNGKVDRRALAAMEMERPAAREHAVAETDTERALTRIWSDVLQLSTVGADEAFFDLGGHSLKAIQIVSRVARDLGAAITIGDLFERPTIRALARTIDAASRVAITGPVPVPDQEHYDVSAMQRRIWLASRTPEGSAAYNMAGAFWIDGTIDVPALRRAFAAVASRHEALRTVFVMAEGSLRQQVRPADSIGDVLREIDLDAGTVAGDALPDAVRMHAAAPFDLARGPIFGVDLITAGAKRLLLVRLHHIAGDASSIRILLDEALALYDAFRTGAADPLPPLTLQYRDAVAWHNARAATAPPPGDMPRTGFTPDRLAPDAGRVASDVGRVLPDPATPITCDLDATLTAQLRDVSARHGTTLFSVVVAAVNAILYRHTGQEDLVVGTTVSRRDHPMLERQIGCYIDTIPLRTQTSGRDTAAALIDRTARVCREALAREHQPSADAAPAFTVLVDYVPGASDTGTTGNGAGLSITELPLGVEGAHYDAMFLIEETAAGTALSIRLVFTPALFSPSLVADLRARLLLVLRWLAADGADPLSALELLEPPRTAGRRVRVTLDTK